MTNVNFPHHTASKQTDKCLEGFVEGKKEGRSNGAPVKPSLNERISPRLLSSPFSLLQRKLKIHHFLTEAPPERTNYLVGVSCVDLLVTYLAGDLSLDAGRRSWGGPLIMI